jgi:tetraprenyl-beta-curcumene synthase
MLPFTAESRLRRAGELSRAASLYWLGTFGEVRAELRSWNARAAQIPDATLRALALSTIREEHGNVEGAAAFAVLAPRRQRAQLVRALSAFQVTYDYVDTLVEQQAPDPLRNGLALHRALCVALSPVVTHANYYRHHPGGSGESHPSIDGGYLHALVERCIHSVNTLPSAAAARAPARLATRRMQIFQALNHRPRSQCELARWATSQTDPRLGLRWWESAAATASSLTVFALMAASSRAGLTEELAWAVHGAYYPWIAALHVLLDSLVDHEDDVNAGRHSLIEHYRSPQHAAERIGQIAQNAVRLTVGLPNGRRHTLILQAMAGFYLSVARSDCPHVVAVRSAVLDAIGHPAGDVLLIMRARRGAARFFAGRARTGT